VFLFRAVVFARPDHVQSEGVPIEFHAGIRVGDYDSRVIDAEKEHVGGTMPFGIAFVRRKLENLQIMAVRISEIEGADAGRILVPFGKALGSGGGVLDLVLTETLVGPVHVANDNGDVLEPAVMTPRVHRYRSSLGSEIFRELDRLFSQPHTHDTHAQSEDPLQKFVFAPGDFGI
jgi:hypothetical protein